MNKTKIKAILLILMVITATFLFSVEEENNAAEDIFIPGAQYTDPFGFFICLCDVGSNCGCILIGGTSGPSPNMRQ